MIAVRVREPGEVHVVLDFSFVEKEKKALCTGVGWFQVTSLSLTYTDNCNF